MLLAPALQGWAVSMPAVTDVLQIHRASLKICEVSTSIPEALAPSPLSCWVKDVTAAARHRHSTAVNTFKPLNALPPLAGLSGSAVPSLVASAMSLILHPWSLSVWEAASSPASFMLQH